MFDFDKSTQDDASTNILKWVFAATAFRVSLQLLSGLLNTKPDFRTRELMKDEINDDPTRTRADKEFESFEIDMW